MSASRKWRNEPMHMLEQGAASPGALGSTLVTGRAPGMSGSRSQVAWYQDSSGTIQTPAMHAGAAATPSSAHRSSTLRSLPVVVQRRLASYEPQHAHDRVEHERTSLRVSVPTHMDHATNRSVKHVIGSQCHAAPIESYLPRSPRRTQRS